MRGPRNLLFAAGAAGAVAAMPAGAAMATERDEFPAARGRLALSVGLFALCFLAIALRLIGLAAMPQGAEAAARGADQSLTVSRPDILDRNGELLATDVKTASLFANPRQVIDADDAADRLQTVLTDLDGQKLRKDLRSDRAFVFVKRELTPAQRAAVHALGIPGLDFVAENRRIYPAGNMAAHILGHVNVDHEGGAGIEKYLDSQGLDVLRQAGLATGSQAPIRLSVDLRVQHALRQELAGAMDKYRAEAAAGVILNAHTGEVAAMVSLPDYDPNHGEQALDPTRINRVTSGVFELGSTFKAFTTAMALETGVATLNSVYDASRPIRIGSFTIDDHHGKHRPLSVSEIFIYSSNIGAAHMALDVGRERHQAFLRRLGLLDRLATELPESGVPLVPKTWRDVTTVTASFGHGISVTPLQTAAAAAALVNGGYLIPPTFLARGAGEAKKLAQPVLGKATSEKMRHLMRLNVRQGTAKKADVAGYLVGGKTGTSEKIVDGTYRKDRLLTSFMGAFPMDRPEYVFLIMLDEPKGLPETHGYATSGWNAVPVSGRIIARIAPMLGIAPRRDADGEGPAGGGQSPAIFVSY